MQDTGIQGAGCGVQIQVQNTECKYRNTKYSLPMSIKMHPQRYGGKPRFCCSGLKVAAMRAAKRLRHKAAVYVLVFGSLHGL
jgi:hypothetical protein